MSNQEFTELEKRYLDDKTQMLSLSKTVLRYTLGAVAVIFSSLISPSAESNNIPFSGYIKNTKKLSRYTKFKKAVIRKQDGKSKKSDSKILSRLNSSNYALDEEKDSAVEDENIKEIYDEYMRTHQNED